MKLSMLNEDTQLGFEVSVLTAQFMASIWIFSAEGKIVYNKTSIIVSKCCVSALPSMGAQ